MMLERDGATKNPSGMDRLESARALLLTTTRANAGVSCSNVWVGILAYQGFRFQVSEEQ